MNKYKLLLIIGISAYTSLVARENPFAKAYETQEVKEQIDTEGIKSDILSTNKEQNSSTAETITPIKTTEVKTLDTIEKEMEVITKKDPEELKNNDNNNQYIDGSPITEAVWEKLEHSKDQNNSKSKEQKEAKAPEEPKIIPITKPIVVKVSEVEDGGLPIRKSFPIPNEKIKDTKESKKVETKKNKPKTKKNKYRTAFKNSVVRVEYSNKNVKIITKSGYIKKRYFTNPKRVSFDFKRDIFFKSGNKTISKNYASRIKVGAHGEFFRVTLNLEKGKTAIAHTRKYGLLISFK